MKATLNIRGRWLPVEVLTQEEIARSGAALVAVPEKLAHEPYDLHYVPGTAGGFPCSLCAQDCILVPSGQQQHAMGNPIVCLECMGEMAGRKSS